jgi:sugar/nucleoside kinase (ribokinase family)
MPAIVVLGEALIDLFAESGVPLKEAQTFRPLPGGAPANVAVALARLGADVGFVGKVGIDGFGSLLIDTLTREGVDTAWFTADPHAPTMLALVAAPRPTVQDFVLYSGASALLSPGELPYEYITGAQVFVYGSVTLASDSQAAAVAAARWARDAGQHVVFDVNLRPALWPDLEEARLRIGESVALANVVKLNEAELEFLTGVGDPVLGSERLLERDVDLCCVSMGSKGAYFDNGTARGHVPACAVNVRDTTGSGDAFVAGLAYRLRNLDQPLANLDASALRYMIAFANACGGLAATQIGAMSAAPSLAAVEQMLQADPLWRGM